MNKKKILFVASEFASGMRPFATTIINTLAAYDEFDVHCLCVNAGKQTYKGMINEAAHPVYVEYPQSKLKKFYYKLWPYSIIIVLDRLRRNLNPEIVHFLTGDFTLANYVCLHPSSTFYYTVHDLHPHDLNVKNPIRRLFHKYIILGYKKMHRHIENLTTSSLIQIKELSKLYPAKNIKFTHFPTLVTDKIARGKMKVNELNDMDNYILFFGNVEVYKGVDLLVEAFKRSNVNGKCKLIIAGHGYLQIQPDKNIVRIDRFIEDEELGDLFRKSTFVVYPYRSATMSGVLSLAFYFHKKVILSDIPFFKDSACELTTFFRKCDIDSLRQQIEKLYEEGDSRSKSETCYEEIFSQKVLKNDYVALYEKQNHHS